jgi:DNA-binding transcriptional LysR family regulator
VELRHLRYFLAVAEERSFSRAAERLGIAQPPLSQQIRRLERDLGFPVFERLPKGIRLTPAGEALVSAARSVLQAADEARKTAESAHLGVTGRLVIGFINSAAYSILPRLLRAYSDAHARIKVDAQEMAIADQIDALAEGRIHAGILRPPVDDRRLEAIKLVREPFVVAVPAGHVLASREELALADLQGEPLVSYPRGHPAGFRERIDAVLRNAGVTPRFLQEATHVHTLCGLVAGAVGISIVPAGARVLALDGVTFVPLDAQDLYAEVCLAWSRIASEPQVQGLVTVARTIFCASEGSRSVTNEASNVATGLENVHGKIKGRGTRGP